MAPASIARSTRLRVLGGAHGQNREWNVLENVAGETSQQRVPVETRHGKLKHNEIGLRPLQIRERLDGG